MARQGVESRRAIRAVGSLESEDFVSGSGARLATAREPELVVSSETSGSLACLSLGALLAPLFAFAPIVNMMGWFLSSLVHEMGHAAAGWFFGSPTVPAISLEGHAAAMHGEQSLVLCLMVWGALCTLAFRAEPRPGVRVARGLALVGYPLFAFSPLAHLFELLGGHGAELVFSAVCLARAALGETGSPGERIAYAALGWFLFGRNLALTGGLLFSEAARAEYAASGSFGLVNDYLRLAAEFAGGSLAVVALVMSLAALAVPVAGIVLLRLRSA